MWAVVSTTCRALYRTGWTYLQHGRPPPLHGGGDARTRLRERVPRPAFNAYERARARGGPAAAASTWRPTVTQRTAPWLPLGAEQRGARGSGRALDGVSRGAVVRAAACGQRAAVAGVAGSRSVLRTTRPPAARGDGVPPVLPVYGRARSSSDGPALASHTSDGNACGGQQCVPRDVQVQMRARAERPAASTSIQQRRRVHALVLARVSPRILRRRIRKTRMNTWRACRQRICVVAGHHSHRPAAPSCRRWTAKGTWPWAWRHGGRGTR